MISSRARPFEKVHDKMIQHESAAPESRGSRHKGVSSFLEPPLRRESKNVAEILV